jgi:hypothetical protein
MKLDSEKHMGLFNFFLSARFAIDDELFNFITSCYDISTSKIHRNLEQMATDKYLQDQVRYYCAVKSQRIQKQPKHVSAHDPRQSTLDAVLVNS